jgi:hypothetical protein
VRRSLSPPRAPLHAPAPRRTSTRRGTATCGGAGDGERRCNACKPHVGLSAKRVLLRSPVRVDGDATSTVLAHVRRPHHALVPQQLVKAQDAHRAGTRFEMKPSGAQTRWRHLCPFARRDR